MDPLSFAALAGVAFFAALVQGAIGFGFSIMAVPVFLLIMGSLAAIQVTAAINFVISLVLIPRLLKGAPGKLIVSLIFGSVIGFPIGLAAFKAADLASVKIFTGLFITVFALFLLFSAWRSRATRSGVERATGGAFTEKPVAEIAVGIMSGAMAVALALPGPSVMLYLLARHAGKQISRSATLILFGFSYGAVSLVHTIWGGMTGDSWLLAAQLAPFVAAGGLLGHTATRYLSEERFRTVVLTILIVSGLYGVWTAF